MGSEVAAALLKVQAELKPIPRTRKGQSGTRRHKYADLADVEEAVFPLLTTAGLAWITKPTTRDDGRFVLYYALVHAASGEREDGEYPLHGGGTAQQQGSEVTYARRYCLCAVTGATAEGEDDDGAAASDDKRGPGRPRQPQRPTAPVTRTRTTGADHERLRHGTVEPTPDDHRADRGPLPDGENPWQDVPPEEQPGSADMKDVRGIQIAYGKLGFDHRTDRAQLLNISEQIIGRPLEGPNAGRTHNNLTYPEGRKLRDTLESLKGDRGLLMERLTEAMEATADAAAQDAVAAVQAADEAGGDGA